MPEAADERFAPTDPGGVRGALARGPYLLWVGGLATQDPRKNLDGLIDAFARWRAEAGRGETLVLAGGMGPAGEELRALAGRTGARVEFAGFVPDDDLPALYSGARCLRHRQPLRGLRPAGAGGHVLRHAGGGLRRRGGARGGGRRAR